VAGAGACVCASAGPPRLHRIREAAPEAAHIGFANTDIPDPHKAAAAFVVDEFAGRLPSIADGLIPIHSG
jgi:hypothetical protein